MDGDLTSSITSSGTVNTATEGTYTIVYSVSDAAGNYASVLQEINVGAADTTAPVITLTGSTTIDLTGGISGYLFTIGDTFTYPGATATDDVDGDLTSSITSSGTVDTSVEGYYDVLYSVKDAAGNSTSASLLIVVRPAPAKYSFLVTASSNSEYTLSGSDYYGSVYKSILINIGDTLSFDVNAPNHPFYIKTVQGTGTDNQVSNVTNNGATGGVVNWTPTSVGTYYYQCSVHDSMYGVIAVQ